MAQEFGQGEAQGQRYSTHALPHAVRAHTPAHAGEGEEQRYNTQRDFHLRRSNRMLLWHGSRISNWAAILSTGPLLHSCPTLICPHAQRTRTHARTHTHTHSLNARYTYAPGVVWWTGLRIAPPEAPVTGYMFGKARTRALVAVLPTAVFFALHGIRTLLRVVPLIAINGPV
jgi:hypothetical protein